MLKVEQFGRIEDGKLVLNNPRGFKQAISQWKECKVLVQITRRDKRSLQANAYYWSCVVPMVKEGLRDAGYDEVKTDEDAHEVLKHLFLKQQVGSEKTGGVVIEFTRSTTQLTKEMFNDYLENIWKWASEFLGVVIPNPGESVKMFD